MTNKLLHAVHIPENARTETQSELRQRLAKTGRLQNGPGLVEGVGLQPGEQLLTGYYSGKFSEIQRRMTEELFDAGGVEVVPFAARGDQTSDEDGYYALEQVSTSRPDPTVQDFARFDGRLVKKGTRQSHWRSIKTKPQSVNNPWGSTSIQPVGVTVEANKVQWFDPTTKTREPAEYTTIYLGEREGVAVYDARDASFDDPVLLYDLPYDREWRTDCRVWDTYNRPKEFVESGDIKGARVGDRVGDRVAGGTASETRVASQWQRVYTTDHDWTGDLVIEGPPVRVRIDKPSEYLRVSQWDQYSGSYDEELLGGGTTWRLYDSSLTRIGQSRVDVRLDFADTDSNSTARQRLNMVVRRGRAYPLFYAPKGESVPSGLIDRLDPVADTIDTPAFAETGVRAREET